MRWTRTGPEASHAHLREAALFLFLSVISCCGMLLALLAVESAELAKLVLVLLSGLLGLVQRLSTEKGQRRQRVNISLPALGMIS